MENGYKDFVDYVVPNVYPLLELFRELELPIVWTNWVRRSNDGFYGAVDRFYGPTGVADEMNPCYIYGDNGTQTVEKLAPRTEAELSRLIESLHLNKFADLDEEGREILYPMLRAWGVNTIVLVGAWTDDCIAATAFDAVDRYGFDVIKPKRRLHLMCDFVLMKILALEKEAEYKLKVLVHDGLATASIHGAKMIDVLCAAVGKCETAAEIARHLRLHPNLIEVLTLHVISSNALESSSFEPPKDELRGNVYKKFARKSSHAEL